MDFARQLAKRGYDLVLVARRERQLRDVAEQIVRDFARRVEIVVADLARADERERLVARAGELGAPVEVLVNNAGLGLYGRFDAIPWEKEAQMLAVDVDAVVHLTKRFVPLMTARKRGYVLNVASIAAFQPTPLYATYAAAKTFVRSFSQALDYELRGSGVSVTVVSPGIAATEFLAVSKQDATPYQRAVMMTSAAVVRSALDATFRRRPSVVPGFVNWLTAASVTFTPTPLAVRIAHALMRSNDSRHE